MARMTAPPSGAKIRMYRQGHGDCFLLAFRKDDGDPYYVLIDCGLFPGSRIGPTMEEVAEDIRDATNGRLDLVVITHEHKDHVSGFQGAGWNVLKTMHIERCWLAWTENPRDRLARRLRRKYNDTLLGLLGAAKALRGAKGGADSRARERLEALLGFEIESDNVLGASAFAATNKQAMKNVKDKAAENGGTQFLSPHRRPLRMPDVDGVRVFVLGPPRRESWLRDLNPKGDEEFHIGSGPDADFALLAGAAQKMGLAAAEGDWPDMRPFGDAGIPENGALRSKHAAFFRKHYRSRALNWRRIDGDWLRGAEQIALKMSNYINNTSLVLAFELPRTRKVLLFVGDAQRGNWASWHRKRWTSSVLGGEPAITATDLLNRTVFYKVGHHGSHNATLKDKGLDLMAQDEFEEEFVAAIPANQPWANTRQHWRHPLPAIRRALRDKARGRVLLSNPRRLTRPSDVPQAEWQAFLNRVRRPRLYFELTVRDD